MNINDKFNIMHWFAQNAVDNAWQNTRVSTGIRTVCGDTIYRALLSANNQNGDTPLALFVWKCSNKGILVLESAIFNALVPRVSTLEDTHTLWNESFCDYKKRRMSLKEAIMQFSNGTALIMATMADEWHSTVIASRVPILIKAKES